MEAIVENKYKDIEPDRITSAVTEIKGEVDSTNSSLSSLSGGLSSASTWTASAKAVLTGAFDKLTGEVKGEIETAMNTANTVASKVTDYKTYYDGDLTTAYNNWVEEQNNYDSWSAPADNPNASNPYNPAAKEAIYRSCVTTLNEKDTAVQSALK